MNRAKQRGAATFLSPQKRLISPTVSGDKNVAAPRFCRPHRLVAVNQPTSFGIILGKISCIAEIIHKRPGHRFSVAELAAQFRKTYGLTAREWRREVR